MRLIELRLSGSPSIRLPNRRLHRWRDRVRVEYDPPIGVTTGPADGLQKRAFVAQEALSVSVENRHQ